jgi:hypothetical protein
MPSFGPVEHEVRDEARHEHEVDVARAGDLVGDVEVVASGVPDRGRGLSGDGARRVVLLPSRRPCARVGDPLERTGQLGERPPVGHVELAQQGRDVALDRPDRDEQATGDRGVAEVLAHQRKDLGLAF